jgi:hypothetical protein
MRIISLITILFLLFSHKLSAEILKKVELTGNKRTKKEAIIHGGQIKIGKELPNEGLNEIKENLGRINQIHLKNVTFKNGILEIVFSKHWNAWSISTTSLQKNFHFSLL